MKFLLVKSACVFLGLAVSQQAGAGVGYVAPSDNFGERLGAVSMFRANELSVDLFGSYVDVDSRRLESDWGGGLGVNYFFTKRLGIGSDILFWNGDGNVTSLSGNVILRAPIETGSVGLAPYFIGGVGGTFDEPNDEIFGHLGGGLELRLNQRFGVFGDARYVWEDEIDDTVVIRAGVRFVF